MKKIKSALKIPKPYKDYFTLLVMVDQPELNEKRATDPLTASNVLRASLSRQESALQQIKRTAIVPKRDLFRVYAALGAEEEGAKFEEILSRTKMEHDIVLKALQSLMDLHAVEYRNLRFYPKTAKIDFLQFQSNELSILTQDICSEISNEIDDIIKTDHSFIFYSAFSVRKHELPRFKESLREAIFSVLDVFGRSAQLLQ